MVEGHPLQGVVARPRSEAAEVAANEGRRKAREAFAARAREVY